MKDFAFPVTTAVGEFYPSPLVSITLQGEGESTPISFPIGEMKSDGILPFLSLHKYTNFI